MNLSLFRRPVLRTALSSRVCSSPIFQANFSRRFSISQPKQQEMNDDSTPEAQDTLDEQKLMDENYSKTLKELETSQMLAKDLHHQLLLKYADAENKRRDRLAEIKRRGDRQMSQFGGKIAIIYESLAKVCESASASSKSPDASDKVKALTEGLSMTRGIFKNVLEKHNIIVKKTSE